MQDQNQRSVIENCDAAIWANMVDERSMEVFTEMKFFKSSTKILPTDLGYKYHIMLFREGDPESIEIFCAIIGDQKAYIERLGRGGYNGMLIKEKSVSKRQVKKVFSNSLKGWGFDEKYVKSLSY